MRQRLDELCRRAAAGAGPRASVSPVAFWERCPSDVARRAGPGRPPGGASAGAGAGEVGARAAELGAPGAARTARAEAEAWAVGGAAR